MRILRSTAIIIVLMLAFGVHANAKGSGHHKFPPVIFGDTSDDLAGFIHGGSPGDGLSGVAWFDYDRDGWIDFYVANGIGHDDGLMRNNGDGTFTNVSGIAGIGDGNGSTGVVAGDLDNDGDDDLVVAGDPGAFGSRITASSARPLRIFRNNGDGTFTDITDSTGVNMFATTWGAAMHPTLGDIDNDSFLDIYVTAPGSAIFAGIEQPNHLFLNNGDMTFDDISASSGVGIAAGSCEATFSHFDRDRYIDLYVADCGLTSVPPPGFPGVFIPRATPFRVFKNNGDRTFTELEIGIPVPPPPEEQPFPTTDRGFWMCIGLGDFDLDRDFDLFSTNLGLLAGPAFAQPHGFFRRESNGTFTSIEDDLGITAVAPEFGWGCSFADFNNDGWEDLILVGNDLASRSFNNPGYLFVNEGGSFRPEPLPVSLVGKFSSGEAVADYNNDGLVDILVSNASYDADLTAKPTLLTNVSTNRNNWLTIRLEGRYPSNRSAIGAKVFVKVRNRVLVKEIRAGSSFGSQDSPWLTFGLNKQHRARRVIVRWPSGQVERFKNVRGGRTVTIVEGEGIVH